jgi:excisionase family DNA binding protein
MPPPLVADEMRDMDPLRVSYAERVRGDRKTRRCGPPIPRARSAEERHEQQRWEYAEMQNGGDSHAPGGVPPLVAALLAHPDQVPTLSPVTVRGALIEVAGVEQRLVLLTVMLAARLGEDGDAKPTSSASEQGALTQEEAAKMYSMPLRTLRSLTRTGRIPSYVLGRNRMVQPADLDRYLARCRAQGVKVGTRLDV